MTRVDEYAAALRELDDAEPYLVEHSGLPGPRGNIELARAAAEVRSAAELRRWAALDDEYLAFCGVVGLGRLLAEGDFGALAELRTHAGDERWRVREAVAMGLQRWGSADFDGLAAAMAEWADGSWLERRAAAAALCEPVLLTDAGRVQATLNVLESATGPVEAAGTEERRSEAFKAFRKGLGYCWSVAVAAAPETGWPVFEAVVERAATGGDTDLRWIARGNLRKRRLERLDAGRVAALLASVGTAAATREAVPRDDPRREPGEERDEHG